MSGFDAAAEANLPAAIRRVKALSGRICITVLPLIDKHEQIPDHSAAGSVATGDVLVMTKAIFEPVPGMSDRRRSAGAIAA